MSKLTRKTSKLIDRKITKTIRRIMKAKALSFDLAWVTLRGFLYFNVFLIFKHLYFNAPLISKNMDKYSQRNVNSIHL